MGCIVKNTIVEPCPHSTLSEKRIGKNENPPAVVEGFGTELKKLLESLGIEGCSECALKVSYYNAIGVNGCKNKRAEIIAGLAEQRDKRGWGEVLSA